MVSIVGNCSGMQKILPRQSAPVAGNMAIVCATLRCERLSWRERGAATMRCGRHRQTSACLRNREYRGLRPSIAHTVPNPVDGEWVAIAAPTSRNKNYRLNSDARDLHGLHPRAQDADSVLQRLIDSQGIDQMLRCLDTRGSVGASGLGLSGRLAGCRHNGSIAAGATAAIKNAFAAPLTPALPARNNITMY
jgi:hypothetical protein